MPLVLVINCNSASLTWPFPLTIVASAMLPIKQRVPLLSIAFLLSNFGSYFSPSNGTLASPMSIVPSLLPPKDTKLFIKKEHISLLPYTQATLPPTTEEDYMDGLD